MPKSVGYDFSQNVFASQEDSDMLCFDWIDSGCTVVEGYFQVAGYDPKCCQANSVWLVVDQQYVSGGYDVFLREGDVEQSRVALYIVKRRYDGADLLDNGLVERIRVSDWLCNSIFVQKDAIECLQQYQFVFTVVIEHLQ